jgi:hypothetical protein
MPSATPHDEVVDATGGAVEMRVLVVDSDDHMEHRETVATLTARATAADIDPARLEEVELGGSVQDRCAEGIGGSVGFQCDDATRPMSTGAVRVFTWRNAALPVHCVVVGVMQSAILGVLYGELSGVMAVEGETYEVSRMAIMAPWALRVCTGFLSDRFPVAGHRRKSWACLGWAVCAVGMLVLAIGFREPRPYYCEGDTVEVCNSAAREGLGVFVGGLTLAMAGVVLAAGGADGALVEAVQSQANWEDNGRLLVALLMLRVLGDVAGYGFLALVFNGPQHLGTAPGEVSLWVISLMLAALAMGMAAAWVLASAMDAREVYRAYSRCHRAKLSLMEIHELLGVPLFAKLALFLVLAAACLSLTPPVDALIQQHWAEVNNLQWLVSGMCGSMLYLSALCLARCQIAHLDWRVPVAIGVTIPVSIATGVMLLTCMDVLRNPVFVLVQDVADRMPLAAVHLLGVLAAANIAGVHQEATIYGLALSLPTAGVALGRSLAGPLYDALPVMVTKDEAYRGSLTVASMYIVSTGDTERFRAVVAVAVAVGGAASLAVLLLLGLVPRGPLDVLFLGGNAHNRATLSRPCLAWTVTVFISAVVLLGVLMGVTAVLPNAACIPTFGGAACGTRV